MLQVFMGSTRTNLWSRLRRVRINPGWWSNEPAMERVIGLIKEKSPIAPSSLDLEVVYLRGNHHSFHAVIAAPLFAAGDQLSIDTGAGKAGMHRIQNALAFGG